MTAGTKTETGFPVTYTVEATLSRRDLADVLTTALEGGIGYWSKCQPKRSEPDGNGDWTYTESRLWVPEDDIDGNDTPDWLIVDAPVLRVEGWDGKRHPWYEITPITLEGVALGVQRVLAAYAALGGSQRAWPVGREVLEAIQQNDLGAVDATAADVIVQYAIFDTVIYG